ncbi:MAG: response regulator [Deltaproteobacteria bacterium]|nr:response regulator [Deltaproteobacteria bacterium]
MTHTRKAEINLDQLTEIRSFVIAMDEQLTITWASKAILRRAANALNCKVFEIIEPTQPEEKISPSSITRNPGKQHEVFLRHGDCFTPLIGQWLPSRCGFVLLARPCLRKQTDLDKFTLDDFTENDPTIELLTTREEYNATLKEAKTRATALRDQNKLIKESRHRLALVNAEMEKAITERQQMENETRQLATITKEAVEGIAVADLDGNIQYINNAWAEMHGYGRDDDPTGKPLAIFHTQEQLQTDVIPFNKEVMRLGSKTGEVGHLRKDGTTFPTIMNVTIIKDEQGKPYSLAAFAQDITERKQAEEQLLASNIRLEEATARANDLAAQAEHANAAKSEFLANMSHEIRTPMNGVIGMSGLLLETDLSDEQRRYAGTVQASAESLLRLINDILDFSKIEAGKLEMETLDFDLHALLDDFAEMIVFKAHEKGLEFSCAAAPGVPAFLQGDPGRLRQILVNLTVNAAKFTQAGEIAVLAYLEAETEEDVLIRFSVSDTGIGIPASRLNRLFRQFTQVDASTTRKYGGSGLGLAISKQLAQAMGGEIGVVSEEGRGSEFWFTARFIKQPEQERCLIPPPELRDARHSIRELRRGAVRILLAEDNITNQQVALGILRKLGLSADAVANGVEAVRALESIPYDLVLMDVQMPEMDGYEATAKIRDPKSSVHNHDIPIIAMTAHAMQGDRKKCLEAGMNDYLSKPVAPQALAEMLKKWLPKQKKDYAPGGSQETGLQVFDKSDLLNRLMDDEDLAQTIIAGFLGDIPEQIEKLKDYLQSGDASGAERQAHTIKGASANVSGAALSEVAFGLEKAVLAGDFDVAKAGLPALEAQFEKLKEAMKN